MTGSRRAGGITKRCECRDPAGKLLSNACPKLVKKNHGALYVRQELPPDAEGKRRTFRRTGYGGVADAQTELDKVRAILRIAGDDEDARRRVGDLLQNVMRDRLDIPEPTEVSRRLGVGVPLDGAMTVAEWLDTWVAAKRTRKTTTTGYLSHIRVHLKPGVGHYRLDRFTVGHAQEMFDAIDDANEVIAAENAARREQEARATWGKRSRPPAHEAARLAVERAKLAEMRPYRPVTGPATKQRIRSTLRVALNGAIKRQLITFNPASWVELDSGKRPKAVLWDDRRIEHWQRTGEKPSAVMVWTPTQIGAFLDVAESDRLYALFHLIAFRGLRRGEAVGQDWVNVDLDGQAITIAKEIVVHGWVPVETEPKTDGSAATIGLDTVNVQALREHRARQLAERKAWNKRAARERAAGRHVADWVDMGKVFVQENGTWLHPEVVSEAFRRIVRTAGLPPINLRDLRHCAATLIHGGGGDMYVIKETLRHSGIKLASDTYTSLLKQVDLEIAEKAVGLVPRARKSPESE
ncbi:site-specific integrase [Streptomyces niveus]|uniref:site-specific integrase n=1 Tax=Streptomyces niveus TaxID=193462 RepID=UPI0034237444